MRIKSKAHIAELFDKFGQIGLESECMVNGAMFIIREGEDRVRCEGFASYYEKEEITTLETAIDYVWKERRRYIEDQT